MTSPPSASSSPASLQGNRELDPPRPKQGAAGGGRRAPWGTAPARALPMAVLFQPGPARHMDRPRSLASTSPGRHEHAGPLFACVGNVWTPRERRLATLTRGRERGEGGRECSHCVRVCARVCAACNCACRWCFRVRWMVLGPRPGSLALGPGPWPSALCRWRASLPVRWAERTISAPLAVRDHHACMCVCAYVLVCGWRSRV